MLTFLLQKLSFSFFFRAFTKKKEIVLLSEQIKFAEAFFPPSSHFDRPTCRKQTKTPFFQLDENSFSGLKVKEHHYNEVDNLTLDSNLLKSLPEKLLDMNLQVAFSARNNNLTSVRNYTK